MLAANGPPRCAASPRGTTNSANSMITAMRFGVVAGAPGSACRFSVRSRYRSISSSAEPGSRISVSEFDSAPERALQPVAPVLAAARRAHAAAAVVAQHHVVGGEHDLLEERGHRQQLAARRARRRRRCRAGGTGRRSRTGTGRASRPPSAAASALIGSPGRGRRAPAAAARSADPPSRRRPAADRESTGRSLPSVAVISSMRRDSSSGSVDIAACSRISSTCCSMPFELGVDVGELAIAVGALLQPLPQDLELAAEAAGELLAQPRLLLLPLERRDLPLQLGIVLGAPQHAGRSCGAPAAAAGTSRTAVRGCRPALRALGRLGRALAAAGRGSSGSARRARRRCGGRPDRAGRARAESAGSTRRATRSAAARRPCSESACWWRASAGSRARARRRAPRSRDSRRPSIPNAASPTQFGATNMPIGRALNAAVR